jgi:hypothetical protein
LNPDRVEEQRRRRQRSRERTWTAADREATRAEYRQRLARHGVHLPEDADV